MTFSAMLHAGSRPRRECAWERFRHCPGSRSEATGFYQNERTLDYKIQPGDNLFIRATSIIDEKNSVILNGDARGNYLTSDASIYLNSYTVNKDGYIDYPLTGLVYEYSPFPSPDSIRCWVDEDGYVREFTSVEWISYSSSCSTNQEIFVFFPLGSYTSQWV